MARTAGKLMKPSPLPTCRAFTIREDTKPVAAEMLFVFREDIFATRAKDERPKDTMDESEDRPISGILAIVERPKEMTDDNWLIFEDVILDPTNVVTVAIPALRYIVLVTVVWSAGIFTKPDPVPTVREFTTIDEINPVAAEMLFVFRDDMFAT